MNDTSNLTIETLEKIEFLSDEEIRKLDFQALCAYLDFLKKAEELLEGGEK